ncbi:MAG: hypothetical protein BalsKO_16510 [Balneolaceae bacterium]
MAETPSWIKQSRAQWEYRGQKHPAFAKAPKTGQESVWDYPRPPKLESDRRIVTIQFEGILIT